MMKSIKNKIIEWKYVPVSSSFLIGYSYPSPFGFPGFGRHNYIKFRLQEYIFYKLCNFMETENETYKK